MRFTATLFVAVVVATRVAMVMNDGGECAVVDLVVRVVACGDRLADELVGERSTRRGRGRRRRRRGHHLAPQILAKLVVVVVVVDVGRGGGGR